MKPFADWEIGTFNEQESEKLSYPPLISALLCARGYSDIEKANEFLRDDIELLCDPYSLTDMDKAVSRINQALQSGEKITVYGDYDVDGITAACLMSHWLLSKGALCEVYIPERLTEGYGISEEAVRTIASGGSTLIVSVDCGVTAFDQVEIAKSIGIDIVITDHHECPENLPNAVAVVDPRRKDCSYPFKGLAGVGVAFKLLCALEGSAYTQNLLDTYGDLVAIGTIADIMPVIGENRAIIRHGIRMLREGKRCGLRKLMQEAGLPYREISGADLSFMLVPKLNAAGRMGQVRVAYNIIMCEDEAVATEYAEKLCALNVERREIENKVFGEICDRLIHGPADNKIVDPIVVAAGHLHHGVSGIVASRLADKFGVPAIVICWENDGIGRGSCRSFGNFSIFDALDELKDELSSYGGHYHAAGLTIKRENLTSFIKRLKEYYRVSRESAKPSVLPVDFAVINLQLLSLKSVESLAKLAPWGTDNPPPILALTAAKIESITPIGGYRHLKCKISKEGESFDCIFFGISSKEFNFRVNNVIDIAFEPIVNEFRGVRSVQFILRDVRQYIPHHRQPKAYNTIPENVPGSDPSLNLCRKFFSGGKLNSMEKFLLKPERSDLVLLWKLIESGSENTKNQASAKIERLTRITGIGNPGKTYIGLKIFEELGLIKLIETEDQLEIKLSYTKGSAKVDLSVSNILKQL